MSSASRAVLLELYQSVRSATSALAAPLAPEDCVVQTMPDVSPTKWHLAHTSWFFERFVLQLALSSSYRPLDPRYDFLFNSYYNAVGPQYPRHQRGHVSRPTLAEVVDYRQHVDRFMRRLLEDAPADLFERHAFAIELGLNHEEQHQELILTDVKHVLCTNPLRPAYATPRGAPAGQESTLEWLAVDGGMVEIGHANAEFCFDNELPRHKVYLEAFELASRPVTCREYLAFIRDGGYRRSELWLSDGWTACQRERWSAPLYWESVEEDFSVATLSGLRPLGLGEPVCHVSYYEADAFARWAGARLPAEAEWERAAAGVAVDGNFVESGLLHPAAATRVSPGKTPAQLFGDVWEWTQSPYVPYSGYQPFGGAFGEYNGKFMCNQLVLRGGSCVSPRRHLRASYRNFFPPDARWQFSGIRLARSHARASGAAA
jgi:ergothioneine biosynthesis protein EgtB